MHVYRAQIMLVRTRREEKQETWRIKCETGNRNKKEANDEYEEMRNRIRRRRRLI
jgi:hypothetical protein